jgi:hypothetical protein
MRKLWSTTKVSKTKADERRGYLSLIYSIGFESDPRELRISKSLVSLSNNVETLREKVAKLDRKIKENA